MLKEKLISAGAEKLADILLSLHESNKDLQKQLNIIFAGLDDDPKKIRSIIQKEISALKRSTKFIDYYEAEALSDRLNQLRLRIANDLNAKSPALAFELMLAFLDLHENTLNRADDSNGNVGGVFREACEDLGKISENVHAPISTIVELVFSRFTHNHFGIYDQLIWNFKNTLKNEGLDLLQDKLEKYTDTNDGIKVTLGLMSIADCRKDVDAYIKACSFIGPLSNYDYLAIAKRLIDHWRAAEALEWIDKVDERWEQDKHSLRIKALELNGNHKEAQDEGISWLYQSLNPEIYGDILKHSKPESKESTHKCN